MTQEPPLIQVPQLSDALTQVWHLLRRESVGARAWSSVRSELASIVADRYPCQVAVQMITLSRGGLVRRYAHAARPSRLLGA